MLAHALNFVIKRFIYFNQIQENTYLTKIGQRIQKVKQIQSLYNLVIQLKMSDCNFDSTRSQYSILDESLELKSGCSKSRNYKYFQRKPISDFNCKRNQSNKKRDKDSNQFLGFYSPTQKHQGLMKKSLIDKALCKISDIKIKEIQEKNTSSNSTLGVKMSIKDKYARKNLLSDVQNSDATFKKRKQKKDDGSDHCSPPKNKQNPQKNDQVEILRAENKILKQQIASLRESQIKYQVKVSQLYNLKQYITQLQLKIHQAKTTNQILQIQIQEAYSSRLSLQSVQKMNIQNIRSLTEINKNLRKEVSELQHKMKYAGIEIATLRKTCQQGNLDRLVQQRNIVRQKNRQLRGEITKLKGKVREVQLFQLTPENTDRDYY